MAAKLCKICGSSELVKGRRLCAPCNRKRSAKYSSKERRAAKHNATCEACSKTFRAWRKSQIICGNCYKESLKTGFKKNGYCFIPKTSKHTHREIAEKLIGRKLDTNEVVHHVDENPLNNELENLWVMSRHHHGKLHGFLRLQKVIYEKSLDKHSVNCWNILRVDQTTAWLEMTSAKVIKLIELDNQQPSF